MLVNIWKQFLQLDKVCISGTIRMKSHPLDSSSVIKRRLMMRSNNFNMQLVSEIDRQTAGAESWQFGFMMGTSIVFRQLTGNSSLRQITLKTSRNVIFTDRERR